MYYKRHKVSFMRCGSNIDCLDWVKKKKATINLKNRDNKCFQYTATVALYYEEIESHPERVSSIKPFINEYNWKETHYLSKIDYWKTFISQKIIRIVKKKEFLMIPNEEKKG